MPEWANFTRRIVYDFSPPIDQETIDDFAPSKHTGTVHDYVNNFTAYVLHVGIANKLHQEHQETTTADSASDIPNTNNSTDPNLAHTSPWARNAPIGRMEHASVPLSFIAAPTSYVSPPTPLPPHVDNKTGAPPGLDITINTSRAIPDFDADLDHIAEREVDATSSKIECGSAPPPPTVAMTCHHTPTRALLPLVDYNIETTTSSGDTTDPSFLAQLRLAIADDHELQIIFTTIEVHGVAPASTLQHGIIHYYIPTSSPLSQDLLKSLGTTTPHPLAIGLHIDADNSSIPLQHPSDRGLATPYISIDNSGLLR
jgi:hypothetical protein